MPDSSLERQSAPDAAGSTPQPSGPGATDVPATPPAATTPGTTPDALAVPADPGIPNGSGGAQRASGPARAVPAPAPAGTDAGGGVATLDGAAGADADSPGTPVAVAVAVAVDDRMQFATQRQLVWWRFRRHRLAVVGGVIVALFYFVALIADFVAYADPQRSDARQAHVPPQSIDWFDGWRFSPRVHPVVGERDPVSLRQTYAIDDSVDIPVHFFARGYDYKFLGLIPTDRHLIGTEGVDAGHAIYLFGTDERGRDVFSRLMIATRTSLLIGLGGVAMSVFLGVLLGGLSGYYGGVVDTVIQRAIEVLRSIPTIPLWMGLAAAMPRDWGVYKIYFAMTLIVSLIGWTELGRVVRGRLLQLRSEDFVTAAELAGARPRRIIFVHMVPLFASHIIAATTLALPLMIIAETSLSFLGLGLRAPAISWGVMLQQAQNLQTVAFSPWLLFPVIPVVVAILAFNFLGDGLRDAADPYDVQ